MRNGTRLKRNLCAARCKKANVCKVATFLAEHRHIHSVFRSRHLPHYTNELEADLVSLQTIQPTADLPPLISEPYISEYALYLQSLSRHVLLAHWFALVYPYIQIPHQGCLVEGLVPDTWLQTSAYFHVEDDLWVRKMYEDEVTGWRSLERYEFFAESPEVYVRLQKLFSHL